MELTRFKADHMKLLLENPSMVYLRPYMTELKAKSLEALDHSYTGIEGDKILFAAGVVPYWENRAEAWAIIDQQSPHHFMSVHNAVKRFLNIIGIRRIEAAVDVSFQAGHRWCKLLGFTLEAERLKAYKPDGTDCSLYAKVRGE